MDELGASFPAEDLGGSVRDDLVRVGIRRGARACLIDVDRELFVELAVDDLLRRRGDRPRTSSGEQAKVAVGLRGGSLDEAKRAYEPAGHGLARDREVQDRALGR